MIEILAGVYLTLYLFLFLVFAYRGYKHCYALLATRRLKRVLNSYISEHYMDSAFVNNSHRRYAVMFLLVWIQSKMYLRRCYPELSAFAGYKKSPLSPFPDELEAVVNAALADMSRSITRATMECDEDGNFIFALNAPSIGIDYALIHPEQGLIQRLITTEGRNAVLKAALASRVVLVSDLMHPDVVTFEHPSDRHWYKHYVLAGLN